MTAIVPVFPIFKTIMLCAAWLVLAPGGVTCSGSEEQLRGDEQNDSGEPFQITAFSVNHSFGWN